MCGILGITEKNEGLVRDAARTFAYRGPDASAVLSGDEVTLGHNRLSIIDLDPRANQPMKDAGDTHRIIFNGEIYNYKELKRELASDYPFTTESDTEVLLAAYRTWGSDMTRHLRGMYAFAIHDRRAGKLVLATDYSGMKPIFYTCINKTFAFASELKGILAMIREKGIMPEVDRDSLDLYWALGYVPAPRTIYKGLYRMPRRTLLTIDVSSGELAESTYELPAAIAQTAEEMRMLLEQSIERHLVADVPVGLFFSGGTDSSLIASILAKKDVALQTFSLEIDQRPEDKEYFEKIAKHLKVTPNTFFFGPKEFDDTYAEIVQRIDEPLYDSALFPTYFIAREAAKKVKVVLSGDGGDEYFLGYAQSVPLSHMHAAALDEGMSALDYLYAFTPRFRGKADAFARLFRALRRPISYYLVAASPAKDFITAREWRAAKRALAKRAHNALDLDATHYLENDILRKTDLATMYNSIEGRLPLLDPDVISGAVRLMKERVPLRDKKPLLKEILAEYLPKELVYRGKRGFGLDARVYFAKSQQLRQDFEAAIAFLSKRKLLPAKTLMPIDVLIARRSQMCWQILFLYHALKNAGV